MGFGGGVFWNIFGRSGLVRTSFEAVFGPITASKKPYQVVTKTLPKLYQIRPINGQKTALQMPLLEVHFGKVFVTSSEQFGKVLVRFP